MNSGRIHGVIHAPGMMYRCATRAMHSNSKAPGGHLRAPDFQSCTDLREEWHSAPNAASVSADCSQSSATSAGGGDEKRPFGPVTLWGWLVMSQPVVAVGGLGGGLLPLLSLGQPHQLVHSIFNAIRVRLRTESQVEDRGRFGGLSAAANDRFGGFDFLLDGEDCHFIFSAHFARGPAGCNCCIHDLTIARNACFARTIFDGGNPNEA